MKHYKEYFEEKPKFNLPKARKDKDGKKRAPYCKDIFVLDIETTSLFINEEGEASVFDYSKDNKYYKNTKKAGIMYIWQFSINDTVYYGRSIVELFEFILSVKEDLKGRKMMVWVHNLAMEFQWLRNVFEFKEVFARQLHRPMSATTVEDITFRCTYILTNMSLKNVGKQYNLPVQKKDGDLNYKLARHSETELTKEELEYCENDCLVVYELIKLMLSEYKNFKRIPLTATGIIRRKFQHWLTDYKAAERGPIAGKYAVSDWKDQVSKLVPEIDKFLFMVGAYAGGYTHANANYTGKIMENVTSYDFTSSYPYVMLSEKYPMRSFIHATPEQVKKVNIDKIDFDNYAILMDVTLEGVESISVMPYIQYARAVERDSIQDDNGRIAAAKKVRLKLTEVDFQIIRKTYDIDKITVNDLYWSKKDYLPKEFITFIIEVYKEKNRIKKELKELEKTKGKESPEYKEKDVAYTKAKANLNGLYGMCVTNYIADEALFEDDEWKTHVINEEDIKTKLEEQRNKDKKLLPYQWGVWIPAWARYNLFTIIEKLDFDIIYSDTDSCKFINNHEEIVDEYNKQCDAKIKAMCAHYDLDFEDLKGIGYLDNDGNYNKFITLGAKKYAYTSDDKQEDGSVIYDNLHITVSGVNKKAGAKALGKIEEFKPNFTFDYYGAGKLELYYVDDQPNITFTDYQGKELTVHQAKGICFKPTTYKLGLAKDYERYIINSQSPHASILM